MRKISLLSLVIPAFIAAAAFRFIASSHPTPGVSATRALIAEQKKASIGCRIIYEDIAVPTDIPPLPGWGNYRWKITTSSDSAQFYFNQGINMYYAFHTIESRASFKKAIRFDSTCAMAWYGRALSLGPNINVGKDFRPPPIASVAAQNSEKYKAACTPLEKDLIEAIQQHFSADTSISLVTLQLNYTRAMEQLSLKYPENADIITLYADALMVEHPWDLYDINLRPKSWTPGIRKVLDQALAIAPLHPGANHLRVHLLEGSLHPEDALKNATLLATLMPGASHMVHMPAHIYIRTGYYRQGIESNDKAVTGFIAYSQLYQPISWAEGFYSYHATHLKAACAQMAGNYHAAMEAGDSLHQQITAPYLGFPAPSGSFIQYQFESRIFTEVRFGKWEDILKEPVIDTLPYASVIIHFARGMAFSHLQRFPEAHSELQSVKTGMQHKDLKIPADPNSSAYEASLVAENILTGVLAEQELHPDEAISAYQKAITAEDNIIYNEPRDWPLPARQYLGNILLRTGAYRKAISVFNRDLQINPLNGWSLTGLELAYKAAKAPEALREVEGKLKIAWQIRDVAVERPVF
jgi:tetratricopeptide (TPR) repeat protein